VLEDACKHDTELRAVLGDSIGNPELMRKKVGVIFIWDFELGLTDIHLQIFHIFVDFSSL